jgi:hypothetical protein
VGHAVKSDLRLDANRANCSGGRGSSSLRDPLDPVDGSADQRIVVEAFKVPLARIVIEAGATRGGQRHLIEASPDRTIAGADPERPSLRW